MKISEISIKNFRSFGDDAVIIPVEPLTALVGGNSSGKSNVLKALDVFFNYSKRSIKPELFHCGDISTPIEIKVTFTKLDTAEKKTFKRNLSPDGNLRIRQSITTNSSDSANSDEGDEDEEGNGLADVHQERRGVRKIAVPTVIEWLNYSGTPSQAQLDSWWLGDLTIGEENFKNRFPNGKPTPEEYQNVVDKFWEEEFETIPQTEWLNKTPNKTELKKWWKESLTVNGYDFKANYFPGVSELPTLDQFNEAIEDFWLNHEDKLITMQHEGSEKILGWGNKLKGNLPRALFVPAVRYIEDEMRVNKTSPFGIMINWLLGDLSAQRRAELQRLIDTVVSSALPKKVRTPDEREQLQTMKTSLNQTITNSQLSDETKGEVIKTLDDVFSIFTGVPSDTEEKQKIVLVAEVLNELVRQQFDITLDFVPGSPEVQKILGTNVDLIGDDGYVSSIREKGEGVQRTVIFAILRAYARLREKIETDGRHRNTIFLIEEPEICLHPSIRRATYNLLRSLSEGDDQVIYTTHDGYFVDVRYFDEIRLFRRTKAQASWTTKVSYLPISHLVQDSRNRYGGEIAEVSIREHFGRFYHPTKSEGFFARRVVLVEGATEEYSLPIYFKSLGYDVDLEQTSIINAESVQHIDSLFLVFNELGIPCYVIFDGDKPQYDFSNLTAITPEQREDIGAKSKRNKNHLEIFGASDLIPAGTNNFFPVTTIHQRVAIFENDFEAEVHMVLPNYEQLKTEATKLYRDSKPLIARHIAQSVSQEPKNIPSVVSQILEQVKACQHHGTCLKLDD